MRRGGGNWAVVTYIYIYIFFFVCVLFSWPLKAKLIMVRHYYG